MEVLVAARFLQGLGAGTVPPIATSRSAGACRSGCGRGCSRCCRRPGSCPACSDRPSPGRSARRSVGAPCSWACCRCSRSRRASRTRRSGASDRRRTVSEHAATLRERLPLALLVAAGAGLLLARPDERTARAPGRLGAIGAAWRSSRFAASRRPGRCARRAACRRRSSCAASSRSRSSAWTCTSPAPGRLARPQRDPGRPRLTAATLTWTAGLVDPGAAGVTLPAGRSSRPGSPRSSSASGASCSCSSPRCRPGCPCPRWHRRPRHGPRLLAARADRAARGATAPSRAGVVGAVADGFAGDGPRDRDHRSGGGRVRRATPVAACRGLAVGFARGDRASPAWA